MLPNTNPKDVSRDQAERLVKAIKETKIIAPPTECIVPIGEENLQKGLKKEVNAEFYAAITRPPSVYRGNPFLIEAAIAYGGELIADDSARVMRFANRVPLQHQQGACAATEAIISTAWKSYGLQQGRGAVPIGPAVIVVHMASVWVPFTSEAKEAIAHYPEIIKEMKLALQECGRELAKYTNRKRRYSDELKKRGYIDKYIPHVSGALQQLLDLKKIDEEKIQTLLREILERARGKLKEVEQENLEYDESFAKIGNDNGADNEETKGEDE